MRSLNSHITLRKLLSRRNMTKIDTRLDNVMVPALWRRLLRAILRPVQQLFRCAKTWGRPTYSTLPHQPMRIRGPAGGATRGAAATPAPATGDMRAFVRSGGVM